MSLMLQIGGWWEFEGNHDALPGLHTISAMKMLQKLRNPDVSNAAWSLQRTRSTNGCRA